MAKPSPAVITGVDVRDGAPAALPPSLRQLMAFSAWNDNGLVRFDGEVLNPYHPSSGGDLLSAISSRHRDAQGGLWIGYQAGGVSFLQNGRIRISAQAEGLPAGSVGQFAKTCKVRVWVATLYGLARLESSNWHIVWTTWTLTGRASRQCFWFDSRGTVWANTRVGLMFLPKGQEKLQVADPFVFENVDIEEAPNARLWIACVDGSVRVITTRDGKYKANGASIAVNFGWNLRSRDGAL